MASTAHGCSVLLLERGKANHDMSLLNPYEKFTAPLREDVSEVKYTPPQRALDGRSLPSRVGKALGGTALLHQLAWHYGCDADFDRWSDLVGDERFAWKNVKPHFKKVS
jgi:choline dehydrogenase-like flavoprotein